MIMSSAYAGGRESARDIPVWDPLVRLIHWTLALAILLNATIVEAESAGNLKRTWVNNAQTRDWFGTNGEGRAFLTHATEVKTVWVPYGE